MPPKKTAHERNDEASDGAVAVNGHGTDSGPWVHWLWITVTTGPSTVTVRAVGAAAAGVKAPYVSSMGVVAASVVTTNVTRPPPLASTGQSPASAGTVTGNGDSGSPDGVGVSASGVVAGAADVSGGWVGAAASGAHPASMAAATRAMVAAEAAFEMAKRMRHRRPRRASAELGRP
ncbi:hypothetical protein [Agromyces bauzanensis]